MEVPIPTFPLFNTVNNVVVAEAVDDAMVKSEVFVSPLFAWIESFAYGEVVPIPTNPLLLILIASDIEPALFFTENNISEVGVVAEVFVNIDVIRPVVVAEPLASIVPKLNAVPIPFAPTEVDAKPLCINDATLETPEVFVSRTLAVSA